jgi:hypothetical protein
MISKDNLIKNAISFPSEQITVLLRPQINFKRIKVTYQSALGFL